MIQLSNNNLQFSFPKVHKEAHCSIDFQRTLRIPDDNSAYSLPPGLGSFPVKHVDDYSSNLPASWEKHGGVFVPMYQAEALWVNFSGGYPCAVKIAAGKINAVSGEAWSNQLSDDPQDYMVIPDQPWLDGFNVSEGLIRQFVAMPLGSGYSAEEQITGEAEFGGLQIIVYPMKAEEYHNRFEKRDTGLFLEEEVLYCRTHYEIDSCVMGLAPGGLMHQSIEEDEYGIDVWDQENGFRCFVHLANSDVYEASTGNKPPHKPVTAKDYSSAGLPWFDFYSEGKALSGSKELGGLSGIAAKSVQQGDGEFPDNTSVTTNNVKVISQHAVVRDGIF